MLLTCCAPTAEPVPTQTPDPSSAQTETSGQPAHDELNPPGQPVEDETTETVDTVEPEISAPPRIEPSRVVFDLLNNRHLAHRLFQGGLWIDAGAPGFPRYAHGNRDRDWYLNELVEAIPVAVPRERSPSLTIPLTQEQADSATNIDVVWWYESGDDPIELTVNGESLEAQSGEEGGWLNHSFIVELGLFSSGENVITMDLPSDAMPRRQSWRAGLASVFVGPARSELELIQPTLWPPAGPLENGLALSNSEGLAYYVMLPETAHLAVSVSSSPDSQCQLQATIRQSDGTDLFYQVATPTSDELVETEVMLEEAPVGQVVRLELTSNPECTNLTIHRAYIGIAEVQPTVPDFEPPTNVVLWLIDTLRADRITAINPETRVLGPNYDRFAADGVVFTSAYVQGAASFASHASLFAGRYPETIDVLSSSDHLDDDEELLAEVALRAGLTTGGYSSNGHIRSSNGFEQGFSFFVNCLRDNYRYLADGLVSHATRWVDEHLDDPFYLYIGTVDPHVTYRSHEDILPLYDPDPYDGLFRRYVSGTELGQIKSGSLQIDDRDRIRIEAIYDDEVTFSDRHFGVFLDYLEEQGILDETLIILTSDHGDEFWEHGSCGHGHSVHDELVHVPIMMRYPPAIPPGTVIEQGVDGVDLLATLADFLGVEPSAENQGESLLPIIHNVVGPYPRPAFAQLYGRTHAMRLSEWKTIWRRDGVRELYHLAQDPTEQEDVASDYPYELRFITDAMGLFMAYRDEWSKSRWGVASNLSEGFAVYPETQ